MDIHGPKRTIIINAFNSKVLCPLPTNTIPFLSSNRILKSEAVLSKKGRKRSLDHLTYEEKLQRKKLKNREAAQTSRDRKKARMDELEKTVRLLQKCNNDLLRKLQLLERESDDAQKKLRCRIDDLEKENERLKLKEEIRCARVPSSLESTGSAESAVTPLLQGHSSSLTLVLTLLLIQTISLQMIASHGWPKIVHVISHLWKTLFQTCFQKLKTQKNATSCSTKWWHQHQRSWNPTNQPYLHLVAVT